MNIAYYLFVPLWHLFSLLPLRVLYVLSDVVLYPLVRYVVRYRRKLVRRQLRDSFPERTEKELREIEKKFYHFLCDYLVETQKFKTMSREEISRRMEWFGLDALQQRMKERDDYYAFGYIGHMGNWEWLASFVLQLDEEFVGAQLYHPLRNKKVDQLQLRVRSRFGGVCIPMKESLRKILTIRREGKRQVVAFIADQSPKWEAMHQWCTFLNHQTSFFTGTERLGKQLGAQIWYVDVTRPRRGYYRAEVKFVADATKEIPDYELTDRYAQMLEQSILANPHLWLWTHNRWKRTREEWEARQKA